MDLTTLTIAYTLGVSAYLLAGYGLALKSDASTKALYAASSVILGAYFYMYDMPISAAVSLFTAIRIGVSVKTQNKAVAMIFMAMVLATPFVVPGSDYLATIASVVMTYGTYWLHGNAMRASIAVGTAIWVVNCMLSEAYAAALGEMILLIINLATIAKSYLDSRSEIGFKKA